MKTFEESKQLIVERATKLSACSSELKRAEKSTTLDELIIVVRDNASWCRQKNLFTDEESIGMFGLSLSNLFNSGNSNSGYRNSGNRNSGNWNSGNWNRGNRNSGDWNRGNRNSGDSNSGYRNSGNSNSGNWNSGDRNSGNSNSGNWNSGYRNSGDSNSGYRNSGAFCLETNPKMILFDKPCKSMTVREWENTRACHLMYNIDPTIWVPSSIMTDKEKADYPHHETTGGYLKTIPMKEAWATFWGNLNEADKKEFTGLENFDAEIFESITGIKVNI